MYYEMFIELAGDVYSPPQFKQDKNGKLYVEFYLTTSNYSSLDKKVRKWRVFAFEGDLFAYIKKLDLKSGDNVEVKGLFSLYEGTRVIDKRNGDTIAKDYFELRCYAKYIKIITTKKLMDIIKEQESKAVKVNDVIEQKSIDEQEPTQFKLTSADDTF